jgi:periplasmic copper chaperone A
MLTFTHKTFSRYTLLLILAFNFTYAQATSSGKELVSIKDAWVRPTHPGQDIGAAYMTLTSAKDVTLVGIESDATPSVEIHSMAMENGVMKMRSLETLTLIAGKPYKLAAGGLHLMLFDLKKPLIAGEQVNFVLTFKKKNKTLYRQNLKAPVKNPPETE